MSCVLFCNVEYRSTLLVIPLTRRDTTIGELKVLLAAHPDIRLPVAQQTILRQGVEMQDHQLVSITGTVLQVVQRRAGSTSTSVAAASTATPASMWRRPSFQPLPLISHDLPAIPQDVFAANTFFVWCTARTTPCFSEAMVPVGESHNPRCASPDECAALDRHVSIGRDSTGIAYPQELQPANAKPRCSRCRSEMVLIAEQWQFRLATLIRGECLHCGTFNSIELVFSCRGDLSRSIGTSYGTRRNVCCSSVAHSLPNIIQRPRERSDLLQQVILKLQRVSSLALSAITSATIELNCLEELYMLWAEASDVAESIRNTTSTIPNVNQAIEAANAVANKTRDLSAAKQLNSRAVLNRQHDAIVQLTSAVDQCGRVETLIERELSLSLDTGRPDLIQLEFHGCVGDRPHRINANGIRRYIASQPTMRSALARNNRCPEVFGEFVVRCCEPGCPGIVYLPSCRLAGDGTHQTIRNWRSSEEALSRGAILCPLGGCRYRAPFVPDTAGPCVRCRWCREELCEEHQMAWSSCPHTLTSHGSIRARIEEALADNGRPRCPHCKRPPQSLSNPDMRMACTNCNQLWCYSCGRPTTDPTTHNRWCPSNILEHPLFRSASAPESLARVHRSHVLRRLQEARRQCEQHSPGRFDEILGAFAPTKLIVEYDGELGRAASNPITRAEVQEGKDSRLDQDENFDSWSAYMSRSEASSFSRLVEAVCNIWELLTKNVAHGTQPFVGAIQRDSAFADLLQVALEFLVQGAASRQCYRPLVGFLHCRRT